MTTPLPAAADLVTRYECGFVVPFGDPRAAADAVLKLAADASLRAKMGSRGHEAAAGLTGLAGRRAGVRGAAGSGGP